MYYPILVARQRRVEARQRRVVGRRNRAYRLLRWQMEKWHFFDFLTRTIYTYKSIRNIRNILKFKNVILVFSKLNPLDCHSFLKNISNRVKICVNNLNYYFNIKLVTYVTIFQRIKPVRHIVCTYNLLFILNF